ncbi:MAG: 3-deoxy-7-phosphoheptulonate synthase [Candidatus Firestonebacteria bacterium]|nr:3-deoxy-7-phosphoheptulonate synthase [Candidatus Firestonebacteria bacterium]
MIIVMKPGVAPKEIKEVVDRIKKMKLKPHVLKGTERNVIAVIGDERNLQREPLEAIPGVESVMAVLKPYKLASRESKRENTVITCGNMTIGGNRLAIIAGPCTVENQSMILQTAKSVKAGGAAALRGGAFKPRTSPYAFQGLKGVGLKFLADTRKQTGLPIVTEVLDPRDVAAVSAQADILQIGTRNMQNFELLKTVGKQSKPVLLKRGLAAGVEEFLMSAEYIMAQGNYQVILCERGIRTFNDYSRNTLDLTIIPALKERTHLPVIVDPSHGTGKRAYVAPMAKAAIAAGADGLLLEVHPHPDRALIDGHQSLSLEEFAQLMKELGPLAAAVNRTL